MTNLRLFSVAKIGSADLLKLLVENGMITSPNPCRQGLSEAVRNNHPNVVKTLIHLGVDIYYTDFFPYIKRLNWCFQEKIVMKKNNLLEFAINLKRYNIASMLLECGCRVDEDEVNIPGKYSTRKGNMDDEDPDCISRISAQVSNVEVESQNLHQKGLWYLSPVSGGTSSHTTAFEGISTVPEFFSVARPDVILS